MRRSVALLLSLTAAATFVANKPVLRVRSLGAGERTRPIVVQLPAETDATREASIDTEPPVGVVRTAEPLKDGREKGGNAVPVGKRGAGAKRRPLTGRSIPIVALPRTSADNQSIAVTVRVTPGPGGGPVPVYALWQNQPNPSFGSSVIRYSIGQAQRVSIVVYSVLGERVATLVDGQHQAGSHTVQWNGVDDSGNLVRSGLYFYRMTAGTFVRSKKLVLER